MADFRLHAHGSASLNQVLPARWLRHTGDQADPGMKSDAYAL